MPTLATQTAAGPLELVLSVDPGSNPIDGSLRDERGVCRTFVGWLELVSVLEAAMSAADRAPGEDAPG